MSHFKGMSKKLSLLKPASSNGWLQRYALNYRPLFVRQIEGQASEEVKLIVWRALFDMFMVYDRELMIDKTSVSNYNSPPENQR
jgi:hypothetical protein